MRMNQVYKESLAKGLIDIKVSQEGFHTVWTHIPTKVQVYASENLVNFCVGSCCGITELDFSEIYKLRHKHRSTPKDEWMARGLNGVFCDVNDDRIYFVGFPTNLPEYAEMRDILVSFGAKLVNRISYENSNSGNKIQMLLLRAPYPQQRSRRLIRVGRTGS